MYVKKNGTVLRSKTKTGREDEIAERDQRFAPLNNELQPQRTLIDRLAKSTGRLGSRAHKHTLASCAAVTSKPCASEILSIFCIDAPIHGATMAADHRLCFWTRHASRNRSRCLGRAGRCRYWSNTRFAWQLPEMEF